MKEQDVEKELYELAEQEQVRDFSEVWKAIEDRVTPKKKSRKIPTKWLTTIASFAACIILFCSIGIPLLLRQPDMVYFYNNLDNQDVEQTEFYSKLEDTSINVVDLTRYEGRYLLLVAEGGTVKGGGMDFDTVIEFNAFRVSVEFVSDDVEKDDVIIYDKTCNMGEIEIQYKEISSQDGIYVFETFTNYNSVNYMCEIMTDTQDLTIFFNDFLQLQN